MDEAVKMLQAYVNERPEGAQSWLARRMGLSRNVVHMLTHGKTRPSLDTAVALEELTGIPVHLWARDILVDDD